MMDIQAEIKQIGKKHSTIAPQTIRLNTQEQELSLRDLILLVVEQQVGQFNGKTRNEDEDGTAKTPAADYLSLLSTAGKVGFGGVYNHTQADLKQAQDNALQAFEDGLYAVFCNDEPLESLSDSVSLVPTPRFTFVRLTFLTGTFW